MVSEVRRMISKIRPLLELLRRGGARPLWTTLKAVYSGERWQVLPTTAGASPPMTDEILTLSEVAQMLKVAEKTVYTMAQKGDLPAFKVGGQWRFRRTDLNAWIDAKTRRATGEEGPK